MANKKIWLEILAIALVFAMTVVGCDNDPGNGGGGGGNGSLGSTLTITDAQVYTVNENWELTAFTGTVQDLNYVHSGGSSSMPPELKSLSELIDGSPSVSITDGKLNISLGTPKASSLQDLTTTSLPGVTTSTTGVKVLAIPYFYDSTGSTGVSQQRLTSGQASGVVYYYSNKDVSISGTYTSPGGTLITYAMNLKAGWNSVMQSSNQTGQNTYQATSQTGTPSADYKWVIADGFSGEGGGGGGGSGE